jgi:ribosome-associated heat shock protein Hsp15
MIMDQNSVRLDKWLWAARFFKTRALASAAISGGKVHVDGARTKPARAIGIGDRLRITKGAFSYDIVVCALSEQRGPASVAQTLYSETEESKARRSILGEQQRLASLFAPHPNQRPGKHDRRRLLKHKGKA